jgi:hypothetical protein
MCGRARLSCYDPKQDGRRRAVVRDDAHIHALKRRRPIHQHDANRRPTRGTGAGISGLVVDDRSSLRARVEAAGGKLVPGPFLDFLDLWGNRVEVVEYANIQFTKAPHVLRAMGFDLDKNESAGRELAEKGMAP